MSCHLFLQGIFPTQGSNLHLLRCTAYHWVMSLFHVYWQFFSVKSLFASLFREWVFNLQMYGKFMLLLVCMYHLYLWSLYICKLNIQTKTNICIYIMNRECDLNETSSLKFVKTYSVGYSFLTLIKFINVHVLKRINIFQFCIGWNLFIYSVYIY